MNKVVSKHDLIPFMRDGLVIMIGGFLACGTSEKMIDFIIEQGIKDLTIISSDTSFVDKGTGRLIANRQVKKVIASHIGTNPMTGELMNSGEMEVELVPQGTLVERIRAGGYGLGGVLTPTGVGTMVAEGKEIITIKGKDYLLEMPLKADIAILSGSIVDTFGNTYYKGTTRNFNPIMAMAAEHVIVEAEQLVEPSDIDPECIMTPGVLVDYILKGGNDD